MKERRHVKQNLVWGKESKKTKAWKKKNEKRRKKKENTEWGYSELLNAIHDKTRIWEKTAYEKRPT